MTAMTAYSQSADSKRFLDVFKDLENPDNLPFKCDYKNDETQKRILFEYGAAYISKGAMLPKNCLMTQMQTDEFIKQFQTPRNKLSFGNF